MVHLAHVLGEAVGQIRLVARGREVMALTSNPEEVVAASSSSLLLPLATPDDQDMVVQVDARGGAVFTDADVAAAEVLVSHAALAAHHHRR